MKHTSGPWEVRKARTLLHIIGSEAPVCAISISANHVHEDKPGDKARWRAEQEANARLIAAAPELLAAAEIVLAGLNARIDQASAEGGHSVPVFNGIADLHAAINKAGGRT